MAKRFHVYVDDRTYKLIKEAAEEDSRSLSSFFEVAGKQRAKKILNIVNGEAENE